MGTVETWWRTWAPYWEHVENRHLSVFVTESFLDSITSPTLVVGAGQGLVVEHLQQRGVDVIGVDSNRKMVELARTRRQLSLVQADACQLPFNDESFATIIISTGVLDYIDAEDAIQAVLDEAFRVIKPRGSLFTAFYQLPRVIEEPLRNTGVLFDGSYYMARIFEIQASRRPLVMARKIARWTGKPLFPTTVSFIKLGFSVPVDLKNDVKKVVEAYKRAEKDGVSRAQLRAAVPERVPYRGEREVRELFERAGYPSARIDRYADCLVARCRRLSRKRRTKAYRREEVRASRDWVVRTEAVSKHYAGARQKAVNSLTMVVERGTIFGLLGPNGAGKTTTLSMLCGLMSPDSGSIYFLNGLRGKNLKRHIGYVPQELAIYPKLTGLENMEFFGRLYRITGKQLRKRTDVLLEMVGLVDRKHHLVSTYSTGMQRRLNLAAGLIHEPDLILLDEPTVGIDPQSRNCIFEAVLELRRKGVSILYTTHYMEEASRLCDRIVIMDEGEIILEGNPREAVREYGLVRIEFSLSGNSSGTNAGLSDLEQALWELDFVVECRIENEDGTLSIAIENDQDAMEAAQKITQIAEHSGLVLSLNSVVEPNLETLFLEITGKSLRDGAAPVAVSEE